tara:strand:- start:1137 stop:1562 length:426 start_codon:yes stop_codon:yes gene_type:complete
MDSRMKTLIARNARKAAKAACKARHIANPVGVQLKSPLSERYTVILPDASEPGYFRLQYFDASGFSGHSTFNTSEQALHEATVEGFTEDAPGALERLSTTETWRLGVEAQGYRDLYNAGKMSFEAMLKAINALYESSQSAA